MLMVPHYFVIASGSATLQLTMNDVLSKIPHWFETNQLTLHTKKT